MEIIAVIVRTKNNKWQSERRQRDIIIVMGIDEEKQMYNDEGVIIIQNSRRRGEGRQVSELII